jgi:hypothetical protein
LAGGGIAGGAVYGASDPQAAYPAAEPVSPRDYMATVLHALGIPLHQTLSEPDGRPHSVYGGIPLTRLFA